MVQFFAIFCVFCQISQSATSAFQQEYSEAYVRTTGQVTGGEWMIEQAQAHALEFDDSVIYTFADLHTPRLQIFGIYSSQNRDDIKLYFAGSFVEHGYANDCRFKISDLPAALQSVRTVGRVEPQSDDFDVDNFEHGRVLKVQNGTDSSYYHFGASSYPRAENISTRLSELQTLRSLETYCVDTLSTSRRINW